MRSLGWLSEVGVSGFLDILFMWFVIYALLVWSKKTRSASVLTGILIVSGVYLLTRQLNMVLAAGLLEKFFAIILIALVVIFQEELRHFFEQIALWSLRRRIDKSKLKTLSRDEVDILTRTLNDFAKEKVGALIVIRGKDLIVRHLDGGIDLGGKLSEALLKSLFDPSSIGHDGAVYIEGNKIVSFSCHLPLSKDLKKVGKGGTRHAAALGLAELCDAMCLVVSEERGTVSVARHGSLSVTSDPEELKAIIEKFYHEVHPTTRERPWEILLKRNSREKLLGLFLASVIWFVLVFGGKQTYKTFKIPVPYLPLAENLAISDMKPEKVYVTLGGQRNSFYFLSPKKIKFNLQPELRKGVQKLRIYPTDFEFPKDLTMEVLAPQQIEIEIQDATTLQSKNDEAETEGFMSKVKKVIPLLGDESMDRVAAVPSVEEGSFEEQKTMLVGTEVESVSQLEDAKPEEVVRYLENKLKGDAVIEPLRSKDPMPKQQENA